MYPLNRVCIAIPPKRVVSGVDCFTQFVPPFVE